MFKVFTCCSLWFSHFDWITKQQLTLITWDKEGFFCHLIDLFLPATRSESTWVNSGMPLMKCRNLSVFWVLTLKSWEALSESSRTLCLGVSVCKGGWTSLKKFIQWFFLGYYVPPSWWVVSKQNVWLASQDPQLLSGPQPWMPGKWPYVNDECSDALKITTVSHKPRSLKVRQRKSPFPASTLLRLKFCLSPFLSSPPPIWKMY